MYQITRSTLSPSVLGCVSLGMGSPHMKVVGRVSNAYKASLWLHAGGDGNKDDAEEGTEQTDLKQQSGRGGAWCATKELPVGAGRVEVHGQENDDNHGTWSSRRGLHQS